MSHDPLCDVKFYECLTRIDEKVCAKAQRKGCSGCGGRLDRADYPRKPRGGPAQLPVGYDRRPSLCCDGCRKRTTPPSVRFLGRRVYLGMAVVLGVVVKQGLNRQRLNHLCQLLGQVDRRTVGRWIRWWLETFAVTAFWQERRARLLPPVNESRVPASLLERFSGALHEKMVSLLRFLSPLTTTSASSVQEY